MQAKWQAFLDEGTDYERQFLSLAHQQDDFVGAMLMSSSTQDLVALRKRADSWEGNALRLMPFMRQHDPQWFATWAGPWRRV